MREHVVTLGVHVEPAPAADVGHLAEQGLVGGQFAELGREGHGRPGVDRAFVLTRLEDGHVGDERTGLIQREARFVMPRTGLGELDGQHRLVRADHVGLELEEVEVAGVLVQGLDDPAGGQVRG